MTTRPNTSENWSNIVIASADGLSPKKSPNNIILNSGENQEINNGKAWRKIRAMFILKIVLIFILIDLWLISTIYKYVN
mgnify:CR=1 FL=1